MLKSFLSTATASALAIMLAAPSSQALVVRTAPVALVPLAVVGGTLVAMPARAKSKDASKKSSKSKGPGDERGSSNRGSSGPDYDPSDDSDSRFNDPSGRSGSYEGSGSYGNDRGGGDGGRFMDAAVTGLAAAAIVLQDNQEQTPSLEEILAYLISEDMMTLEQASLVMDEFDTLSIAIEADPKSKNEDGVAMLRFSEEFVKAIQVDGASLVQLVQEDIKKTYNVELSETSAAVLLILLGVNG